MFSVVGSPSRSAISSASASPRSPELAAGLEPADQLRGGANADVAADQRLLEPLPVLLVARIEGSRGELAGERAAALPERIAQTAEESGALLLALLRPVGIAEELCPRP